MATATLRTGDVKKYNSEHFYSFDNWAVIHNNGKAAFGVPTREAARNEKGALERIARVVKRTPKTVTVEISK